MLFHPFVFAFVFGLHLAVFRCFHGAGGGTMWCWGWGPSLLRARDVLSPLSQLPATLWTLLSYIHFPSFPPFCLGPPDLTGSPALRPVTCFLQPYLPDGFLALKRWISREIQLIEGQGGILRFPKGRFYKH